MATSNSKNYSITTADIIAGALRKIGVYDSGETISGEDTSSTTIALNLMVKEWVADGADIFLRTESILFLQPNTQPSAVAKSEESTAVPSYWAVIQNLSELPDWMNKKYPSINTTTSKATKSASVFAVSVEVVLSYT